MLLSTVRLRSWCACAWWGAAWHTDCNLSRQVALHVALRPDLFLAGWAELTWQPSRTCNPLVASCRCHGLFPYLGYSLNCSPLLPGQAALDTCHTRQPQVKHFVCILVGESFIGRLSGSSLRQPSVYPQTYRVPSSAGHSAGASSTCTE